MPASAAVVRQMRASNLNEVEQFAAHLPEKYLHCRDLGHQWAPYTASRHKDGGWVRVVNCVRCSCKRYDDLTPEGMKNRSSYRHPDGYLHKGFGQITGAGRGLLRVEALKRITKEL